MPAKRDGDVPGAVWFRGGTSRRRRSPELSRSRIVTAAVRRLDAGGADGLSLRGIADDLGVHVTSLYWHVASKGDVLDLALDDVFGEIALPDAPAPLPWDEVVLAYMRELRAMLLRHPWAAFLAGSRPLAGPRALARSEVVYAALSAGGFTGTPLAAAAAAVSNLVIASASTQAAWAGAAEDAQRESLREHVAAEKDRYPTLAAHLGQPLGDWDSQFEFAVRSLLDGLKAALPDAGG